jgi:hypothetical protein
MRRRRVREPAIANPGLSLAAATPAGTVHLVLVRVFTVAFAAVAVVATGVAHVSSQRAQSWQQRAGAVEEARGLAEDGLVIAQGQLSRSEQDNAALQQRVSELAAEKTQAQDRSESAVATAELIGSIASDSIQVNAAFGLCASYQQTALDLISRATAGQYVNPVELDQFTTDMDDACQGAQELSRQLVEDIRSWER